MKWEYLMLEAVFFRDQQHWWRNGELYYASPGCQCHKDREDTRPRPAIHDVLNEFGAEGWELVTSFRYGEVIEKEPGVHYCFYFKRPTASCYPDYACMELRG